MEQVKIPINHYEGKKYDEMPIVMHNNHYFEEDMLEAKAEDSLEKEQSFKSPRKFNYLFFEFLCCAVILLGILILQNVKNTEDLQLAVRLQIRHNLTSNEIRDIRDEMLEIVQHYENARP